MDVASDIVTQMQADFPPGQRESRLEQLANAAESERIQWCIVWASRGHPWYFDYLCRLAKVDDRDIIMAAEYERLGAQLYDFNKPIGEAMILQPW